MAGQRGQQGRKPKASTIAARELDAGRAQPTTKLPSVPSYLSKVAKAEWRRMGKRLQEAGLLTELDVVALATYCSTFAEQREAQAMLEGPPGYCPVCDPRVSWDETPACRRPSHDGIAFGPVIKGRVGRVSQSPYVAINQKAKVLLIRLLGEFGMTPASRSRIPRERKEPDRRPPAPAKPSQQSDPRDILEMEIQASRN